jgi:alpha-L-rhamnosidase
MCNFRFTWVAGVLWATLARAQGGDTTWATRARWIADSAGAAAADTTHWDAGHGATGVVGPFPVFRKGFAVSGGSGIVAALLEITALGSYQVTINRQRVSDDVLTPDWTDYRRRVSFQTIDVRRLVHPGNNLIAVMVGEGWYGSRTQASPAYVYGPPPVRIAAVLRIAHADGHVDVVATDSMWRSMEGPVLMAQIYAGETYDARRVPRVWDQTGVVDGHWSPVRVMSAPGGLVVQSQQSPTIGRVTTVRPVQSVAVSRDTAIYDMGQNMVGWVQVRVRGHAGDTVRVRHAEVLQSYGLGQRPYLLTENLRTAEATDTYILGGDQAMMFEPHFTYHGFRFVEVATSPGVRVESLVGVVVHTQGKETAAVETDDAKLARLWENIAWSWRGNFMSVPTDCPQRSERLGWLGDAAVFWPTAVYLTDLRTFTRKWLQDLRDTQDRIGKGCFPAFTPPSSGCGGPGWSDAGVLVSYAAWRQYGDTAMVREHWGAMERYMAYIAADNPGFRWEQHSDGYGDWYPADTAEQTGLTLIATAYWAADALAMREMARGLRDTGAMARYGTLYDRIRAAFPSRYMSDRGVVGERGEDGRWMGGQTSDALALRYGLVPDSLRGAVVAHLVADIEAHRGHVATGFVGTSRVLPVLSDGGRDDVAYQLLLQETFPSWLYVVDHGGTTMWERWDGDRVPGRTSFNHYAHGAVGEWLVRYAAGIGQDSGSVGFARIVIHPHPDPVGRLTKFGARYQSPVGLIASRWVVDSATHVVTLTVTVPQGRTARVEVPAWDGTGYRYVVHEVAGGTYEFRGEGESGTRKRVP